MMDRQQWFHVTCRFQKLLGVIDVPGILLFTVGLIAL